MNIHPSIARLLHTVTRIRRDLHRIPETGYCEQETQRYILEYLKKLSPDVLAPIASTGIKAVFYCDTPNALTTGFRADIDGLAIQEENDADYASTHPGRMHACGHDGHMAALLAFASFLAENRKKLRENVVLLFQPAEEQIGGAKRVIAEGGLDDPKIDRLFGLHLWPDVPLGLIATKKGPMMTQTCQFDIVVHGKSAHGAAPHLGIDAIVASAELLLALQTIVSRSVDPYEKALLTVGRMEGGTARNIIADRVVLNGTVRTFKQEIHDLIKRRILEILEGVEKAHGVRCEFSELNNYPVLSNPVELVDLLHSITDEAERFPIREQMAAEDFAFYQQRVPGLFFYVGIGTPGKEVRLHTATFDFDESVLLNGLEIYRRILGL